MSNEVTFKLERRTHNKDNVIGELYTPDGELIGRTLEDIVRQDGIKVPGSTAIPTGRYRMRVSMSNRFKKRMVEIMDVSMFTAIPIHGDNHSEHTEGCPLLGRYTDFRTKVWDCSDVNAQLVSHVDQLIKNGYEVYINIKNTPKGVYEIV